MNLSLAGANVGAKDVLVDRGSQYGVWGEYPMIPRQVHSRRRHQCRESADEIHRLQHDVRGAVAIRSLQPIPHVPLRR